MAFEPFWAWSAHVMQFRPVTMDQAAKDVANNGEDMHPPNSPKLVPRCGYCRPLWAIGRTLCGGNVKWKGAMGKMKRAHCGRSGRWVERAKPNILPRPPMFGSSVGSRSSRDPTSGNRERALGLAKRSTQPTNFVCGLRPALPDAARICDRSGKAFEALAQIWELFHTA